MSEGKLELLFKSPIACKVMAFLMLAMSIAAVIFNLYHSLGGDCRTLDDLAACFTKDDGAILAMGVVLFVFFMWASCKAKKEQEKAGMQRKKNDHAVTKESREDMNDEEKDIVSEKQKCTLNYQGEQVTFYIPANCSPVELDSREEIEEYGFASAICNTADGDFINVHLCPAEDEFAGGAKGYIEDSFSELPEKVQKNAKVEQMLIEGKLCYYFAVCYKEDGSKWQEVYMACDVGKNSIFAVELDSVDNKRKLSIAEIQDIFTFH